MDAKDYINYIYNHLTWICLPFEQRPLNCEGHFSTLIAANIAKNMGYSDNSLETQIISSNLEQLQRHGKINLSFPP